jgi:hypothetical protein
MAYVRPARHVPYWSYDGSSYVHTCPQCGWSGLEEEALREDYGDLFDVSCPKCDKMITIVPFPTQAENLRAAQAGNQKARETYEFYAAFARTEDEEERRSLARRALARFGL